MAIGFGGLNPELTRAINSVARDSANVRFIDHAEDEMEADKFDHADVMTALRKGKAYGPEMQSNKLRANVLHRGIHIRVVVGGLDEHSHDWGQLRRISVVTVMRFE